MNMDGEHTNSCYRPWRAGEYVSCNQAGKIEKRRGLVYRLCINYIKMIYIVKLMKSGANGLLPALAWGMLG